MTVSATDLFPRRGACPGLSAPMPTGDGLLVRLVPLGTISLAACRELCKAARTHGNGVIEVTARGNIQVRGLGSASAAQFATAIAALDIAAADGIPILINPLTGLDAEELIDAGALAAELRLALALRSLAAQLGAKVSVAIDGGGAIDLAERTADVRLSAESNDDGVLLHIAVGGDAQTATPVGFVAPARGTEAVVRLLDVMARRGPLARARDIIAAEGIAPFRSAVSDLLVTCNSLAERRSRQRNAAIGMYRLRDGSVACGIGLSFGHTDAASLERLIEHAHDAGATGFRAAPGRVILAIGLSERTASAFAAEAERLGFIVSADDPRRHVVACAGAPVCASAYIAARAIAPRVAAAAASHLDEATTIHISGCAKGCAHPAAAALTVVGTAEGCALISQGTSRDRPHIVVPTDELDAAIAKMHPALREGRHV